MVSGRNSKTAIVSATDIIFATVMACGCTVFRATYAGMRSVEDILAALRRGARSVMAGPVTVSLRNGTQGWTVRRTLMRRNEPEGMQLSLSF